MALLRECRHMHMCVCARVCLMVLAVHPARPAMIYPSVYLCVCVCVRVCVCARMRARVCGGMLIA